MEGIKLMDDISTGLYAIVGFLILANGATIITVFSSAMKISSEFGSLKTTVKNNHERLNKHDERIYNIEKAVH